MSYSYCSNFKEFIEGLIKQKKSLGYPYKNSGGILCMFDKYCLKQFPEEKNLTRDIVMGWASLKENEHPNGLLSRITPVRQLAKYMNSIGVEAYVIPPKIPKKQIRYEPHIFTSHQLKAFFQSVDSCQKSSFCPGRHLVVSVFFRVLYCCGLRCSESRLLCVSDVDLEAGTLYIRQSKGHKDRLVYLSDDVLNLCRTYDEKIKKIYPQRTAFFPNKTGGFYGRSAVGYWFHLFWDDLPVAKSCPGNYARPYDFRHVFAANRLNHWVEEGKDINAYLPYLSMYMGHCNQVDTDYYLHLVPEFFPVFKKRASSLSENLIPEVSYE